MSPSARHRCWMKQEKAQLRDRNAYLLDEIRSERNFGDVIGRVMVRETVMQEVSLISNFKSKRLRPIRTKSGEPRRAPLPRAAELLRAFIHLGVTNTCLLNWQDSPLI
jgi:hypothetical protein